MSLLPPMSCVMWYRIIERSSEYDFTMMYCGLIIKLFGHIQSAFLLSIGSSEGEENV